MRTARSVSVAVGAGALLLLSPAPASADLTSIDSAPAPARWYDWIDVSAFVDAYASVNYGFPKPQFDSNVLRTYDATNGFSLSWAGIDIGHEPDPVGGLISLRFGPSALVHGGSCLSDDRSINPCDSDLEFGSLKSALVSWRPTHNFGLGFGKFDSPFGAEVAESQNNINYTRGLLYLHAYPLFHTGLRASWTPAEAFGLDLLLVNGWNNTIDNNLGKTFGLSGTVRPVRGLEFRLGWLAGPEQDDVIQVPCAAGTAYSADVGGCAPDPNATTAANYNVDRGGANDLDAWRQLFDLLVEIRPTEQWYVVIGGDYGFENVKSRVSDDEDLDFQDYYGAVLGARYELTPVWALAARGEYLGDPEGLVTSDNDGSLASATLTIDARIHEILLLRLENRGDFELNGHDIFPKGTREGRDWQVTTTFGAVVEID